ncbi:hypothetical protein ACFVR1_18590 [Psychrobacillus sp. NPDC058041]|uniref:hypothetical protein n=1 Tax=Psychrobacillus sp. NPDC058041 TaxID=3346310 RepID=UPI0036DC1411
MKKKYNLLFILGIFVGYPIMSGILIWLGIPTFDHLLELTLGKPNTVNRLIAIIVTSILIYLIYLIPFSIFKLKKKSI